MTFYMWLLKQRERDEPVGDLARDVHADANWPCAAKRYRHFKRYLASRPQCDGALIALQKAWAEYSNLRMKAKGATT